MVPENLFYSSAVKLKLNEAISLNLRGQLQIPFTEFLWILRHNVWTEIKAMTSCKERHREQVRRRTEQTF